MKPSWVEVMEKKVANVKIMGKALLLALLTGGLTAVILFIMDNSYAQHAVAQLVSLPGGVEAEGNDAAKVNSTEKKTIGETGTGSEKNEALPSVETGRQQLVSQTQKYAAQAGETQQNRQSSQTSALQNPTAAGRDDEADEKQQKNAASAERVQSQSGQTEKAKDTTQKQQKTDNDTLQENKKTDTMQQQNEKSERNRKEQQKNADTEKKPKKRTYSTVSKNYFSDAVLIGDSRTVGMEESGLLPNAAYYAKVGIGISGILTQRFISEGGTMLTLEEALGRHTFGKVYIMIGINDMSSGDTDWFTEKYQELLDIVHRTQPEALIFLQGNIPMGYQIQDMTGSLNNRNLKLRNEATRQLADGRNIFYLETEEIYADANGHLNMYFSSDGLHVRPKYYPVWVDFLQHHAIISE